MSGMERAVVYAVARLKCTFDGGGHPAEVTSGTGFWLNTASRIVFVTNRHMVDATIWREREKRDMKLKAARLEFRGVGPSGERLDETTFVDLHGIHDFLHLHPTADCAISEVRDEIPEDFRKVTPFDISMVADQAFLAEKAQVMDLASFVGFPGRYGRPWWDQGANLPIARLSSLASDPGRPFVNDSIPTADVALVSGLSFSGSSGSPIILHEKGIRVSPPLTGGGHIPPKVIGIMSGHLDDQEPEQEMLRHTGLSYFTRSTSILELVREVDR